MRTPSLFASLLFLVLASSRSLAAPVLINEVMYHPASGDLRECYVELFNPDTNAVDLAGWRFSDGIPFSFPTNGPVLLGARSFLVVAADAAVFTTKYPGVPNFLAGWTGRIHSHLKLQNSAGQTISELSFSNEGDWAARILTTNGFATFGHWGWMWISGHDGQGGSLELINPNLPNSYAHNWGSSRTAGGTPGRANSITQSNLAPIITGVSHSPIVPKPSDVVTISARLVDEHTNGLLLTAFYRNASTVTPPAFTAVPMWDDGLHNDGLAHDGIFGAQLPPQPNGAVIEFYLVAQDAEGASRTYPNVIPPTNSLRTANLLYQVDAENYTGAQPIYRLVMTEMERAELYELGRICPDSESDAQMNGTFITMDGELDGGTGTELRYNIGIRNRGHGTRISSPSNYHLNFPKDRPWRKSTGININANYAFSQVLGSAVFRRAGLPMPQSRSVQVRVNSTNLMTAVNGNSFGSYAANEQYNEDFTHRAFALDPLGNSYRGIRNQVNCGSTSNGVAELTWEGADWAVPAYTNAYFKQSNIAENDWSDLIDLLAVLNSQNGYQAANYATDVPRRVNVSQWMFYMALNTLIDNNETCLANGAGDDFALYRGLIDTRFQALPYDLDDVLGRAATPTSFRRSIWRMNALPVVARFMQTPQFAPLYYQWLLDLSASVFSPGEMNPLMDQLFTGYLPQANIDNFKAYNASQLSYVLSQIPLRLTVSDNLARVNNFPYTTVPTVTLYGRAHAARTRTVLVNGVPTTWTAWTASWTNTSVTLNPGLNRVLVQALDENNVEVERTYTDIWYNNGVTTTVGGNIVANTTWSPSSGPYLITSTLTINSGVTLTIQPGTVVYLGANVNLVVANGGRLLAEGTTNALVRFSGQPGSTTPWGGLTINGGAGSPETRIAYALFESNSLTCVEVAGGTLSLDHSTFGTTTHQYLSLDNSSFVVSGCTFPTTTVPFELVHGTGGIKAGGHGIVRDCYFGGTSGYNDIMDFTGGNRDQSQPIIQFYNNVFAGPASDDILDLDGTDAWVEGNIFMHCHRNGAPDSSSAISGGNNGTDVSEVTIVGNLIYDCDNVATAKQGNFFTLINNTIVHTTKTGGEDFASGVVNVQDVGTTFGRGFYLEGNIITDAEQLVRNYDPTQTTVTLNNNLVPMEWTGPGTNNLVEDALLNHIPALSETYFADWQSAQIMRQWFALQPGSPAHVTGPNGNDLGGVIPLGASIDGEPAGTNNQTTASLRVGFVRSGFAIPTSGWPYGSGYTHYKWRLDGGAWSAETPTATPITVSGLANGPHRVEVIGKRDSGLYQDDPLLGLDATVTSSKTWIVDTSYVPSTKPTIRLNEILAQNSQTLTNAGTTPDLIELYNFGPGPVDLSGLSLSDSASVPNKFTFPAGSPVLASGQYLTLYADTQVATPGIHLGFSLKAGGDDLYLFDKTASGGVLLDSVVYGLQVPDYSIGRGVDGEWVLCQPSFGSRNMPVALGEARSLKINEWLATQMLLAKNDFVEIYNPDARPVALGEFYLSNAEGAPALSRVAPLSFVGPGGYAAFVADGDPNQGADHLAFKLRADVGVILLSDAMLEPIDFVNYGPQTTDVSQGRSPNGSGNFVSFSIPTPGLANPVPNGLISVTNITTLFAPLLDVNSQWKYDNSGGTNFGTAWYQVGYNDSTWPTGVALFGTETTPANYPYPFRTPIPSTGGGGHIAVYYRTHFQWNGDLANVSLFSTNYIDDGVVYYLNGTRVGSLRMPTTVTYATLAGDQANEGVPEVLALANQLVLGDNVLAAEVHQVNLNSSDDVFGMQLNAVQYVTNIITTVSGVPVVINEVLASNQTLTNANGTTSDWVELCNPSSNTVDLAGLSLSNDANDTRKFVFGTGASLPAGGHLVVYCDNDLPAGTNNTGFSLDAAGGYVFLFDRPADGGGLIDGLNYGLQAADFPIGRFPDGKGTWTLTTPTPGVANLAAGMGNAGALRINEWMADPASGSDWLELYNSGSEPVSLSGLYLTDDLTQKTLSPVPPLSFMGTGANGFLKLVADNDLSAGARHLNFALSKNGESIGLFSTTGEMIDAVSFGPQQNGVAEGRFPDGSPIVVSFPGTASPAESNYLPLPNAVINEILTHTDPPLEDAVELYNPTPSSVNVGGWFISNSQDDLKKYRVPDGTSIPGYSYIVFYEYQFNSTNGASVPFTFNSAHGDRVYFSQADSAGTLTGYRAAAEFGAAQNGVSFGRYSNSVGQVDFVALQARTFGADNPGTVEEFRTGAGAANGLPLVGPLAINEILFYPPLTGGEEDTRFEYIELANLTAYDLPLFDPLTPTNTWKVKGGIDFTFPQNTTLPAQGLALLVSFDPATDPVTATFRSRYNLGPDVRLFGPYAGKLKNSADTIGLYKPDAPQVAPHPDAGFVPYVLVEEVNYQATAPWPTGAVGTGFSLQRLPGIKYGNDPANWTVGAPSAGQPNATNPADANNDGLPDAWQILYFGSASAPQAAPEADPDGDGSSNLQEFFAGTNPTQAGSYLKIDSVQISGSDRVIHFTAVAGKTYSILFKDNVNDTVWLRLWNVPAQSTTGPISVLDSLVGSAPARFYRVTTPALP